MKTDKILKKVNEWRNNPLMVPAVYRLFVFLKWDDIPEEYRKMYDQKAKEVWDEDIDGLLKGIDADTELTIKAVLEEINKRNVVAALGIAPIILADLFMKGNRVGGHQGTLMSIINDYKELVGIDRGLAEFDVLVRIEDWLTKIIQKTNLKINLNINKAVLEIMQNFYEEEERKNVESSVLKVLADYENKKAQGDETVGK